MNQGADINSVFLGNIFHAGERFVLWASINCLIIEERSPGISQ